jgi:hypothetical protein
MRLYFDLGKLKMPLKKQKILVGCSFFLTFMVLLFHSQIWARSISEIVKTGNFKVAVLRPDHDEFDAKKSSQKNNLLKLFFSKYSQKKFNKNIQLEFIYVNSFSDFWVDKTGKINPNEKYTPKLFEKVDAYFEWMGINDWRKQQANPIPILTSKYALFCNFHYKNTKTNDKNSEIINNINNDNTIHFISIKNSSLDHFLQTLNISKEKIYYANPKYGLISEILHNKEKICTFGDSMLILENVFKEKLFFISKIPEENTELGWWVKKDDLEIANFMKDFIYELKISEEWNEIFLTLFRINYNVFYFIMN